jgi:hypothetical protein
LECNQRAVNLAIFDQFLELSHIHHWHRSY